MVGATSSADGQSGTVPKPTIADKDKVLKGDGTWGTAGTSVEANPSGTATSTMTKLEVDGTIYDFNATSAVSELTDVELTNLADGEILKYDATLQKWLNVTESGGGSGVYFERVLWEDSSGYDSNSSNSVLLSDKITNYDVLVIEASRTTDTEIRNQEFILVSMIDKTGTNWFPLDVIGTETNRVVTCNYVDETHLILGHWTYQRPVKYYKITGLKFGSVTPIIFSEREREVGVWIDNKPLYARTVNTGGSVPSGATLIQRLTQTGYDTLYYTKTTDTPGCGSYNTLGIPTVKYTQDEQVIGTWLGKPLYQKTIVKEATYQGATTLTLTEIDNTMLIKNAFGSHVSNAFGNRYVYNICSCPYIEFPYDIDATGANNKYYFNMSSSSIPTRIELTIQYTKTTD